MPSSSGLKIRLGIHLHIGSGVKKIGRKIRKAYRKIKHGVKKIIKSEQAPTTQLINTHP